MSLSVLYHSRQAGNDKDIIVGCCVPEGNAKIFMKLKAGPEGVILDDAPPSHGFFITNLK